jgi:hypothetical protein
MAMNRGGVFRKYYRSSLQGPAVIFARYWNSYGGMKALITSPYLHISVALLAVTSHYWMFGKWWEQPLAIMPNLLGFSLGGLAIFVGFSEKEFQSLLATTKRGEKSSMLLGVCSKYIHFIVVQVLALFAGIIGNSFDFSYPWPAGIASVVSGLTIFCSGIGYLLFLYAIASMLAAAMSLFRVISWYQVFHEQNGRQA